MTSSISTAIRSLRSFAKSRGRMRKCEPILWVARLKGVLSLVPFSNMHEYVSTTLIPASKTWEIEFMCRS